MTHFFICSKIVEVIKRNQTLGVLTHNGHLNTLKNSEEYILSFKDLAILTDKDILPQINY